MRPNGSQPSCTPSSAPTGRFDALVAGHPKAAAAVLGLTFSGVLPTIAAALLVAVLDQVPGWLFLSCLCALMATGAAWIWRWL